MFLISVSCAKVANFSNVLIHYFLVKSKRLFTRFTSFNAIFVLFYLEKYLLKQIITIFGSEMRGSVFKIIFLILARKFESRICPISRRNLASLSAMRACSRIFLWNLNVHLLNIHHLTIFFSNIMNLALKRQKMNEKPVNYQCEMARFIVPLLNMRILC